MCEYYYCIARVQAFKLFKVGRTVMALDAFRNPNMAREILRFMQLHIEAQRPKEAPVGAPMHGKACTAM